MLYRSQNFSLIYPLTLASSGCQIIPKIINKAPDIIYNPSLKNLYHRTYSLCFIFLEKIPKQFVFIITSKDCINPYFTAM